MAHTNTKKEMEIRFFGRAQQSFVALTDQLIQLMKEKEGEPFYLALSGGETARVLFHFWANEYQDVIDWNNLRFYWVDERCVPPQDDESNFKHADELLFAPLYIPRQHIFRIEGENDPEKEAVRYSELVRQKVPSANGLPCFDCILLGVGSDFHTASIFPDSMSLLKDKRLYAVSQHPVSGQRRITMTGPLILNAAAIIVPVIGLNKTEVIRKLMEERSLCSATPACYVLTRAKNAILYTDCVAELF